MSAPLPDPKPLTTQQLLWETLWTSLAAIGVYILVYLLFNEPINQFGIWFGEVFGLLGVFVFSYVMDFMIMPGSVDVLFPIAIGQAWEPWGFLAVVSLGSILGGYSGFLLGRVLDRIPFIRTLTANYEARGRDILTRWGFWAVVAAALTPVPYSTVSWLAGMLNIRHRTYLLGSLFRIPRVVGYYWAIAGGLQLFPGFTIG